MNKEQQAFLEQLALRIPRLFDAIAQGNIKSEYIVGVRRIDKRHVRLKLVAEVVDPGVNPLATHGQMRSVSDSVRDSMHRSVQGSVSAAATSSSPAGDDIQPIDAESEISAVDAGPTATTGPASRRRRPRKR